MDTKSNLKTEALAGLTTFLASSYIIVVNPSILSQAGMSFSAVLTSTILISFFSSFAMGFFAKNPILLAPGMGLNAFFTFTMVLGLKIPIPEALGAVFWSGVFFLLISVFNIREKIVAAVPNVLQKSLACGIGLFIAFIGFKNAQIIVDHPATLVQQNQFNISTLTFVIGLAVTVALSLRKITGALFWGILITTILAAGSGRFWGDTILVNYNGVFAAPDFSLLFTLDLWGALKWAYLPAVFSLVFTDFFDTLSTFMGVSQAGNLMDKNGKPRNLRKSLIVDGLATALSGIFGTSPTTSYIESAAGIQQGGRTGTTAIVAGLLFLPFLFLSPLLSMIPSIATAPSLIIVGVFMMKPILEIKWDLLDEAIPAFLALIMIPLTYSISNGIVWGVCSYILCKWFAGKKHDVHHWMYPVAAIAVIAISLE